MNDKKGEDSKRNRDRKRKRDCDFLLNLTLKNFFIFNDKQYHFIKGKLYEKSRCVWIKRKKKK